VRAKRPRALASVLLAGLAAAAWICLAPEQLGGSMSYTETVGNSMAPRFHAGDLAVTRRASSYRVGDVVLYRSAVLQRTVLHRIVAVRRGRYFFKGDHNDFVDPGYVTRDGLVGKLWLHVPRAGLVLGWFRTPFVSAAVAGLVALLVVVGGGSPAPRTGRRREGGSTAPCDISQSRRNPALVRFGAPTLMLAAVVASVVAFTAGNSVPASYAGVSAKPVAPGQVAPSQCAGMVLDNQIVATGSTTTGGNQNDLIIGRNATGSMSLNGGAGADCLVAGGGAGTTNTIDGGGGNGDVCIGAPGATNTFSRCETTY